MSAMRIAWYLKIGWMCMDLLNRMLLNKRFTKAQWADIFGDNFAFFNDFLTRTKYKAHSIPCSKGCLREVREYEGKNYALCTEEPKYCDDIVIEDDEICLWNFDAIRFAEVLLNRLKTLPLTPSVSLFDADSLTYQIAHYQEKNTSHRTLMLYWSLLPEALNNVTLPNLFVMQPDFVVLTVSAIPPDIINPGNPFHTRVIKLNELPHHLVEESVILNLTKKFSDILNQPLAPVLSDQAIKDAATGEEKRLKQQARGERRAKDIKYSAQLRETKIEKIALPIVQEKPRHYSANSLAEVRVFP